MKKKTAGRSPNVVGRRNLKRNKEVVELITSTASESHRKIRRRVKP